MPHSVQPGKPCFNVHLLVGDVFEGSRFQWNPILHNSIQISAGSDKIGIQCCEAFVDALGLAMRLHRVLYRNQVLLQGLLSIDNRGNIVSRLVESSPNIP